MPPVRVGTGRKPVAMASGYLSRDAGSSDGSDGDVKNKKPPQVVVVLTDGWIVMCFDHHLKLMWESSVQEYIPPGLYHAYVLR